MEGFSDFVEAANTVWHGEVFPKVAKLGNDKGKGAGRKKMKAKNALNLNS
jgi:hypothetical protein